MEEMRTVFVHLNALYVFGVEISAHVGAFVDDQHRFTCFPCLLGKGRAKQSRTDDEIVVFHSPIQSYQIVIFVCLLL